MKYVLARPIGAVILHQPLTATTLPSNSIVKVIGPAKQVQGCVEVECLTHYAVFQSDLDESGETATTATESA